jgi:hypothetical protein
VADKIGLQKAPLPKTALVTTKNYNAKQPHSLLEGAKAKRGRAIKFGLYGGGNSVMKMTSREEKNGINISAGRRNGPPALRAGARD